MLKEDEIFEMYKSLGSNIVLKLMNYGLSKTAISERAGLTREHIIKLSKNKNGNICQEKTMKSLLGLLKDRESELANMINKSNALN